MFRVQGLVQGLCPGRRSLFFEFLAKVRAGPASQRAREGAKEGAREGAKERTKERAREEEERGARERVWCE